MPTDLDIESVAGVPLFLHLASFASLHAQFLFALFPSAELKLDISGGNTKKKRQRETINNQWKHKTFTLAIITFLITKEEKISPQFDMYDVRNSSS